VKRRTILKGLLAAAVLPAEAVRAALKRPAQRKDLKNPFPVKMRQRPRSYYERKYGKGVDADISPRAGVVITVENGIITDIREGD